MPERVIRLVGTEPRVVEDSWSIVAGGHEPDAALPAGPIAVSLAVWKARRAELAARGEPVGVWLKPDDDPAEVVAYLGRISLVAVHFPKFTDGRGYSTAVLLRTRHGYRASCAPSATWAATSCSISSAAASIRSRSPHTAIPSARVASLDDFSLRYQGSVDDSQPLFRKRLAAGGVR